MTETDQSAVGVDCKDCPLRLRWYPRSGREAPHKHDLVTDHDVEYVEPEEIRESVDHDGNVVHRHDEQSTLVTDGGQTADGMDHLGMSDRTCVCGGGLAILDHIPLSTSPLAKTIETFGCVDCESRGIIHFVTGDSSYPRRFGSAFDRSLRAETEQGGSDR